MSYHGYTRKFPLTVQHQPYVAISQANPVSTTLYEWAIGGVALGNQPNVRLIALSAQVVWAVTQPTPLEVVVTVDGQTITFGRANPVTATAYFAILSSDATPAAQDLSPTAADAVRKAFLLEGRSVKVEARITWATTQPTPLFLRVKWAKW